MALTMPTFESLECAATAGDVKAAERVQERVDNERNAMTKDALVVQEQATTQPVTPMQMLAVAVERGTSIEQLSQLMALQERWEANEARKAFDEALSAFKANAPELVKDKHVEFGQGERKTQYNHATLGNVSFNVAQALSRHGLSHRWEVEQLEGGMVRVTCVLTHVKGHRERTSLQAGLDQSGAKNNIQSLGSTVTYLQRYSLLAAVGLATREQDNDGAGAGMTREEEDQTLNAVELATTKEYLLGTVWEKAAKRCTELRDVLAYTRIKAAVAKKAKAFKEQK